MKTGEIYDIVDRNGKKIGSATWVECHTKGLLHKVVHGLVFRDESRTETLIKLRNKNMVQGPNELEIAVAGHMISPDTPRQSILKEIEEELFSGDKIPIGLTVKKIGSYFNNDILNNHEIAYLFEIIYPGPFNIDQEEASGKPRWVKLTDLVSDMKNNPQKYAQFSINAVNTYLSAYSKPGSE